MKKHTILIIAAVFMAAALSFGCSDSGTDETPPPGPSPSVGAEGGACTAEGTCNTGLACSAETKLCLKVVVVPTCEGEGVCPEGYECKDNKCVSTGPKAGEEGGACLPENECNGALICKASVCSKCTADADCGSDKVCSSSGACEVKPCPDGMVLIEGGTFKMGSDKYDNEKPIHDVTVSAFCMDENEFTNKKKDELKTVSPTLGAKDGDGKSIEWNNLVTTYTPADFYLGDHPLVGVSWYVAKRICELQKSKRLPTEAEWEYAARGGTQAEYGTKDGVDPTKDNACWNGGTGNTSKSTTCNVRSYPPPNAFVLYDMSGNVWEWVADWYGTYSASAQTDPAGPTTGQYRVLRGGSWGGTDPSGLRAASRSSGHEPAVRNVFIGFRCVFAPQDSKE